jgi:uncharacterized protein YcbK (DUF882 family)
MRNILLNEAQFCAFTATSLTVSRQGTKATEAKTTHYSDNSSRKKKEQESLTCIVLPDLAYLLPSDVPDASDRVDMFTADSVRDISTHVATRAW